MTIQIQSQVQVFNFKSNVVRAELINSEPYFCLKDVCSVLSIVVASPERFNLDSKGVTQYVIPTNGGKQELTFINEPNLYRIIFKSRKAEAVEFQNWVFDEVLPQIRKTGKYSLQNSQQNLLLDEAEADEEAIRIIANLYHSLNGAYEMGEKIRKEYPHLGRDIDKFIGGHYLYNLNMPTENALTKARKYVQAKSERIMFIKGMLSLLDEQPQPKRLNNF
ncbi:MAG TPA: BRO family protein [Enterococcus sp.]|nr:BRO family protein [Enterococcus sp.]